jgi:hypothetical protein
MLKFSQINELQIEEVVNESYSANEVFRKLNLKATPSNRKTLASFIESKQINIAHFDRTKNRKDKQRKHEIITKQCPVCDISFECSDGGSRCKTTCSTRCSNIFFSDKRMSGDTKNKIKNSLKNYHINRDKTLKKVLFAKICTICGKPFETKKKEQPTCSKPCGAVIISQKVKRRVSEGTHRGWTTRPTASYPEKYFQHRLTELCIPYEFNYPVPKNTLGIQKAAAYFLDFYFPDIRLDLEIDGKQHLRKDRRESDLFRDELLIKNGYTVFRIPWVNPINDANKAILNSKFDEFLTLYHKLSS